jgi:hypothetical protein
MKNGLITLWKIASPCCKDRASPWDAGRSHSPINLKLLEAGGQGGSWCQCFLCVCCLLFVVLCTKWWMVNTQLVVLHCLSIGYYFIRYFFIGEVQSQIFYILRFLVLKKYSEHSFFRCCFCCIQVAPVIWFTCVGIAVNLDHYKIVYWAAIEMVPN